MRDVRRILHKGAPEQGLSQLREQFLNKRQTGGRANRF
jgi:hypothetical protein